MHVASPASRRYGRAIFAIARDTGQLEAVHADLRSVRGCVESTPELERFLPNYLLPRAVRQRTLTALFSERLHPLTFRFLLFIEQRRRSGLLDSICAAFTEQYEAALGIVRGQLSSAFTLAAADAGIVRNRLGERVPGRLELAATVQPALLGGFRVRVGDIVHDLSLAAQLRMLRRRMAG